MQLHIPASSPSEPTKFGTDRGDRFQTKTGNPLRRRFPATDRPMITRPITPMFFCVRRDIDTKGSVETAIHNQTAGKDGNRQSGNLQLTVRAMRRCASCAALLIHLRANSESEYNATDPTLCRVC